MIQTQVVLYTLDVIALFFLYGLLHTNNLLSSHRKRAFIFGIIIAVLVILSEVGTILVFDGAVELRGLNIMFNVLGFALTPLIPIALISIFDTKAMQRHLILLLPSLVNIFIVVLSPIYGWIFFVDANNLYSRGSYFYIFIIIYIINIVLLAISTIRLCEKSLYPIKWKILFLTVFTIVGTSIQLVFPSIHASWHCVTLSLLILYILLSEFDGSFDTLTGLYNRAAFDKSTKQLTDKKRFAIIAMDINEFKEINDTHGHDYGDIVLKEVASIIKESFSDDCSWFRIGGDEFCVICMDTNVESLKSNLKSMVNRLSKKRIDDSWLPTVSYGYSIYKGEQPFVFQNLMNEADAQMYFFKKQLKEKTTTQQDE